MSIDPRFNSVEYPIYQPALRFILSITQTDPIVITTTFDGTTSGDNQYETGLIVQLLIPRGFGMIALNEFTGPITVLTSSTFSMDVSAINLDPFVIPAIQPGNFGTVAQVVPVGEVTSSVAQSTKNVLPYT
jgi:hypothetical protein